MKILTMLTTLVGSRHTKRFVFLRMALGVLLFIKGTFFISTTVPFQDLLSSQQNISLTISWLTIIVGWTQLIGAFFITLGLFTRMVCLVQLFIITMAILINFSNYTLSDVSLLGYIAVLFGLILFLLKGGGSVSLDRLFRFQQKDHLVHWA